MTAMTPDFSQLNLNELLKRVDPAMKPLWGMMTLQHMLEHLSMTLRASNGRQKAKVVTAPEKLPRLKAFLYSDQPLPRFAKHPLMPENELLQLVHSNLDQAVHELRQEIKEFTTYYKEHPAALEQHPVFGELNEKEWRMLHNKHFMHHFEQFGIKSK